MKETEKLKNGLLLAYKIVREQQDLIYSLMALAAPLVRCLDQYDQRLAGVYSQELKKGERQIFQERDDALAVIDEAVRRLKGNATT